jgi:hypothetical protein
LKTLFAEAGVETECPFQPETLHGLDARAVHQAQVPPRGDQQGMVG